MDRALEAADAAAWSSMVTLAPDRSLGAPLLDGATLRVDARRFRQLVRALLRDVDRATNAADPPDRERPAAPPTKSSPRSPRRHLDALGLARAAITQDGETMARLAERAGIDAGRMATVAQLAIQPLLVACATRFQDRLSTTWLRGYCPTCGAWPALAEMRGLDRSRRLRCGRCSSDWTIPVLRCPFCDEARHSELHALVPDEHEHTHRVDVCESCKGYVKTFATLQALSPRSLAMMDLATVDLDIVAQDRGYSRPTRLAYPIAVLSP